MEINFTKQNGVWVAEFEVTNHFNIHMEREDDGLIRIMQRGLDEGEYVDFFITSGDNQLKNYDCDFGALVYPKTLGEGAGLVNVGEQGGKGCDHAFKFAVVLQCGVAVGHGLKANQRLKCGCDGICIYLFFRIGCLDAVVGLEAEGTEDDHGKKGEDRHTEGCKAVQKDLHITAIPSYT